jgi:hypothetical protein
MANALLTGDYSGIDPATATQIQNDYYQAMQAFTQTTSTVLAQMVSQVKSFLNSGPVLLVPHSQGCLYANDIFTAITGGTAASNNLKIVGVGDTAASVAGDPRSTGSNPGSASYVTAKEDSAIAMLSAIFTVLPANVASGATLLNGNVLSHSFIDVYLNSDYQAWPAVKSLLDAAITSLPLTYISFMATWDSTISRIEMQVIEAPATGYETLATLLSPGAGTIAAGNGWAMYCNPTPADGNYIAMFYNRTATRGNPNIRTKSAN